MHRKKWENTVNNIVITDLLYCIAIEIVSFLVPLTETAKQFRISSYYDHDVTLTNMSVQPFQDGVLQFQDGVL